MKIIDHKITLTELKDMARRKFGNMVKAVIDVERELMAVDGDLHADEEALLLDSGSNNNDLWGINLYPELSGGDWIEYDSMINLRPAQNNRSRLVEAPALRQKIVVLVSRLVSQ